MTTDSTKESTFYTRLVKEQAEVGDRVQALGVYIGNGKHRDLGTVHAYLLEQQLAAMTEYYRLLQVRTNLIELEADREQLIAKWASEDTE